MSVFIAISVFDTLALRSQFNDLLSTYILQRYFGIHWSLEHYEAGCKLFRWIQTCSQVCSSYLVLLFTLERFVSVRFPLKRATICTKRRINTAIISIVVVALLMTSYVPYYSTLHISSRGTAYCVIIAED